MVEEGLALGRGNVGGEERPVEEPQRSSVKVPVAGDGGLNQGGPGRGRESGRRPEPRPPPSLPKRTESFSTARAQARELQGFPYLQRGGEER